MKTLSTREKIIQRSSELFNIYGYHACSLSHIMEATKLKKGGIYNHFKNKDEIAVEAFNYNYNRVLNRFRAKLDTVHTSYDKLMAIIDVFVSLVDDPIMQGGGCPIFNTAMDSTNTHPELKLKAQEGIQGLKKYIEIKLAEGIEAGEFKSDIKVKQISTLLVATLEGAIIMSRVDENKECIEYASEYLKGYIKNNLVNHPFNSPPFKGGENTEGGGEVKRPFKGGENTEGGGEVKRSFKGEEATKDGREFKVSSKGGKKHAESVTDETNQSIKKSGRLHNREHLKPIRKELRNNLTSAEATLWEFLKSKQLEGRKFRRQHSIKNYIVDFYCPAEKMVVELDGAGHYTAFGDREDFIRDSLLNELGIKILRFENQEVFRNIEGVLEVIKSKFKN